MKTFNVKKEISIVTDGEYCHRHCGSLCMGKTKHCFYFNYIPIWESKNDATKYLRDEQCLKEFGK